MRLRDFLAPERVVVPLHAATLQEGSDILLERLAAAHGVLDGEALRARAGEGRPEDVVAMGDRAFLVHYRTPAVGQLLVAIGVAPEPLRWTGGDEGQGEPGGGRHGERSARVVLMVATAPRFAARYLQVVGAFARLLRKPEVLAQVLAVATPAELLDLQAFVEHKLPEQLTVRDVMSDHPRTTQADASLKEAARTLVRTGLGALPVVDEDRRVIGIVSEREVIRHLLSVQAFGGPDGRVAVAPVGGGKTVRDVMTRQVLCVAPEQPLAEVASLMSNKDVDRVPVVREGRLVGFLTRGDIVRKLVGS